MTTLGNSKFCLQVRGTTGYASRMIDSIYSGCIPVFIIMHSHFAFMEIFDYSSFSVFILENEIDQIEETLLKIPDA